MQGRPSLGKAFGRGSFQSCLFLVGPYHLGTHCSELVSHELVRRGVRLSSSHSDLLRVARELWSFIYALFLMTSMLHRGVVGFRGSWKDL